MARVCNDLGTFLCEDGRLDEAESLCREAVTIEENLLIGNSYSQGNDVYRSLPRMAVEDMPVTNDLSVAQDLARYASSLALILEKKGEDALARMIYVGAWSLCGQLAASNPSLCRKTIEALFSNYRDYLARADSPKAVKDLEAELTKMVAHQ